LTSISLDVTDGVIGTDDSTENPVDKQVVIMGAGYDPSIEDLDPATVTAVNTTTTGADAGAATATSATYSRTMGRGLFVLDAETGQILWQTGPPGSDPTNGTTITHAYIDVSDMIFAMPSDPTVIMDRNGALDNRVYIGDTGGNMWRIDLGDHVADWTVSKLASIADFTPVTKTRTLPDGTTVTFTVVPGMRKFLFPPDVVYSDSGYDAVLIGSGDREHPFDIDIVNRFYMFKDTGTDTTAKIDQSIDDASGTTTNLANAATLTESSLFDVTSNCIQDAAACTGVADDANETQTSAANALNSADGWLLTFGPGEKSIGNAVTLNNVTFFNTNQPGASAGPSSCTSDLGIARQYRVRFDDATAILDQNISGGLDAGDRSEVHAGGGYLPSPVPLVVEIDGQVHEGVISGTAVDQPPGSVLNARTRKFWYKEID
jgi:type IV pilus assembly protein PilY1